MPIMRPIHVIMESRLRALGFANYLGCLSLTDNYLRNSQRYAATAGTTFVKPRTSIICYPIMYFLSRSSNLQNPCSREFPLTSLKTRGPPPQVLSSSSSCIFDATNDVVVVVGLNIWSIHCRCHAKRVYFLACQGPKKWAPLRCFIFCLFNWAKNAHLPSVCAAIFTLATIITAKDPSSSS